MDGAAANIKHVVVLMFENRSFDHLFGAFPGANGIFDQDGSLKPDVYNLPNPTLPENEDSNPRIVPLPITTETQPLTDAENVFDHNFGTGMMHELFGPGTRGWLAHGPVDAPTVTYPQTNSGFYQRAAEGGGANPPSYGHGSLALTYFQHSALRVLHPLAAEFVLCDNWYCDAPADTLLNRYFVHAAQTDGYLNTQQWTGQYLDTPAIFDRIEQYVEDKSRSWKIYAPWGTKDGVTEKNPYIDSKYLNDHVQCSDNARYPVDALADDAAAGNLPFYSFLMCWLPESQDQIVTSMHPPGDVRPAENYLAAVYAALRNSPSWNETLLIVTFDESGGFYDHVPPPPVVAPNDKVGIATDDGETVKMFDFTLLGPRVPAILVSPWLGKGIAKGQYQNSSILKFLEELLDAPPLTNRDAQAPSLEGIFADFGLQLARNDCPTSFKCYPGFAYEDGNLRTRQEAPENRVTPPALEAKLARLYRTGES